MDLPVAAHGEVVPERPDAQSDESPRRMRRPRFASDARVWDAADETTEKNVRIKANRKSMGKRFKTKPTANCSGRDDMHDQSPSAGSTDQNCLAGSPVLGVPHRPGMSGRLREENKTVAGGSQMIIGNSGGQVEDQKAGS